MINPADRGLYRGADVRFGDTAGPVLMIRQRALRQRFVIQKHIVEDADFFEPSMAGRVNGVGLRDFSYWAWWLRDEMMSWLVGYMEKLGNLGLLIFYYEEGNAAAKAAAEAAALGVDRTNALAVPDRKSVV